MNRLHVAAGWVSNKSGRLDECDQLAFDKPRYGTITYWLMEELELIAQVSFTKPNALAA